MKGFLFLSLCLLLSFAAIAESPPGLRQETDKIESIETQSVAVFDVATLQAIETDQFIFPTLFVAPQTPALPPGNSNRSCGHTSINSNYKSKNAPATNSAKIGHESNADFKVGWQA